MYYELKDDLPGDEDLKDGSIPYGLLAKHRHPEYLGEFWARARAFYKGGVHLLEDRTILESVFPRHVGESDAVYSMRKKLAHYANHSGALMNHMTGRLFSDTLNVRPKDNSPEWYQDFFEDTSRNTVGGNILPLDALCSRILLDAMQCKAGYILIEMPKTSKMANSLAEQEAHGDLNAWAVQVKPESVIDWDLDSDGGFNWALLCFTSCKRESVFSARSKVTETYWLYDKEGWVKWEVSYPKGEPPKDNSVVHPVDLGKHTFGVVPLVKMELPDGLWVMSKLESLARELFNKRNALAWSEYKALLPVLYEFLDPGMMPSMPGPAGDEDRATSQTRSTAHVQQRQAAPGQGDEAKWIAPPDAPFNHALGSCEAIRDEMHRIVHQMALATDPNASSMRRSSESKKHDGSALDTVLQEYGDLLKRMIRDILRTLAQGRGDSEIIWEIGGLEKFDMLNANSILNDEVILDTVELPSATFKAERKKAVARSVLGGTVSEEKLLLIDQEIEDYFTSEAFESDEEEDLTREEVAFNSSSNLPKDDDDELTTLLNGSRNTPG